METEEKTTQENAIIEENIIEEIQETDNDKLLIKNLLKEAKKIGACDLLTGKETYSQLVKMIWKPQFLEFMAKHNFPNLEELRRIEKNHTIIPDVCLSGGSLYNPEQIAIVGCKANLYYNASNGKPYKVLLLHGAEVRISAINGAVVRVERAKNCSVIIDYQLSNAKILV